MASYQELHDLFENSELRHRITVAVVVAAEDIRTDTTPPANQADRMVWAKDAMAAPLSKAPEMFWTVLAQNKDATIDAIVASTDAQIQTAVDGAVDLFV